MAYFSSARARMIGSTRPNSLNEVKESLSHMAERPGTPMRAAESRVQRHPAWPGLSSGSEFGWRGEIRFNELRARSPQTRNRVYHPQKGHMTACHDLFKARLLLVPSHHE